MPRPVPSLVPLVAAAFLLGACGPASTVATSVSARPEASRTVASSGRTDSTSADEARVRDLFRARARAFEAADVSGWLEALAGRHLIEEQRLVFESMRALHVSDLRVVGVRPSGQSPGGTESADARMTITLTYRFAGFDTSDRRFELEATLADAPDAAARPSLVAVQPSGRPQPWDLPLAQVRRSGSLLLVATGPASRADAVARDAEVALGRVAAVLGTARPAVVVVPDTDESAAQLLGRSTSELRDVAAVTDGPLGTTGLAGADRVVIIPGAWSSLSSAGRQVVLAHELTHVTTRAAEPQRDVPLWLSEGLAEYIAYRDVTLAEGAIVAPALDEVRRSGLPAQWPSDARFDPSQGNLAVAYGLALLACRTIADDHGEQALLRLYRAAAGAPIADAFRASGMTGAALLQAWRGRISRLVSGAGQE